MNNLFTKNLTKSNKEIKAARAEFVGKNAEKAQGDLVRDLDTEMDKLKMKLMNLEDLSPDSELSLHPTKNGEFDGEKWAKEIQATNIALANKQLELDIAKKTYDKYFTELPVDAGQTAE